MPELPSGTLTFLFTDIEGSTRLLQELRGGYAQVLADHHRLLRAAFGEWGGQELHSQGDAFFVAFPRARDAIGAAVAAQRALAAHPWPDGLAVRVRMGLHTGEPSLSEAGLVSLAVHRAARISSAGHGGQVLLSSTTCDLVEDELPDDVRVRDLGEHRLKDLDRPERLYQLEIEGLPADFPPLKTLEKQPEHATPFSGREGELAEAAQAAVAPRRRLGRRMLLLSGLVGVLAAVAVTLAFVIGGGGGGSGPKPLSKDAYQDQLLDAYRLTNAVILKADREVPDHISSGPTALRAAKGLARVRRSMDRFLGRLRSLTPPPDVEDLNERLLAVFFSVRQDVADAVAAADAVKDSDYRAALRQVTEDSDRLGPIGRQFGARGYARLGIQASP
jgi:class 3 adenylate cyclase